MKISSNGCPLNFHTHLFSKTSAPLSHEPATVLYVDLIPLSWLSQERNNYRKRFIIKPLSLNLRDPSQWVCSSGCSKPHRFQRAARARFHGISIGPPHRRAAFLNFAQVSPPGPPRWQEPCPARPGPQAQPALRTALRARPARTSFPAPRFAPPSLPALPVLKLLQTRCFPTPPARLAGDSLRAEGPPAFRVPAASRRQPQPAPGPAASPRPCPGHRPALPCPGHRPALPPSRPRSPPGPAPSRDAP